ncbi:MAG TPA: trypsin-like peptidase domain-containing protein [Caulobacteraceae bacterium]|nr:trypsin-like peptidase domain-containing protein [Caulobacteraceae bacterium]
MPRSKFHVVAGLAGASALLLAGGAGLMVRAQALEASPGGAVNPPGAASGAPMSFADIVAKVAPAVVSVDVVERPRAAPADLSEAPQGLPGLPPGFRFLVPQGPVNPAPVRGSGSGFFISPDGYLVTNNHVVDGAEKITVVTNDQRSLPAHVVGRDAATDLAVLKVDGGPFEYVSFEDRARPRVGDWVVAVGNPFGLGGTATAGIVSALGRQNVSGSSFVNFMQIDAPINLGNSGGPTFDVQGHVVGVNTAIFSPSGGSVGIGFDIPADVADRVTHELMAGHAVTRGYIGATVQNMSPELAGSLGFTGKGALVDGLTAGGPAAQAGLKSGDVITEVNGAAVHSSADVTQQVALAKPGDAIHLSVLRDGHPIDVTIKAGLRPSEDELASSLGRRSGPDKDQDQGATGLTVLGMLLAPNASGGLLVQNVSPNSDAADKGLRRGDVILRAGTREVQSSTDIAQAVAAAKAAGRPSVPLLVARGGGKIFVPVQIGAKPEG